MLVFQLWITLVKIHPISSLLKDTDYSELIASSLPEEGGYGSTGGGGYGGGRGGGGGRDETVMQEDTIFVSGIPTHINEDEIKDHFGAIGLIKVN